MADLTSSETTIAESDRDAVFRLLLGEDWREVGRSFDAEEVHEEPGLVTLHQEEVNYGGEADGEALRRAGIPYRIVHGEGGGYTHGEDLFDGRSPLYRVMDDGRLKVLVDEETGEVNQDSLETARRFLERRRETFDTMHERNRLARGGRRNFEDLWIAARKGDVGGLRACLAEGVDRNATTPNTGQSALHITARYGHALATEFLLSKGLDPSTREAEGQTPLDLARERGHEKIAQTLEAATRRPQSPQRGR